MDVAVVTNTGDPYKTLCELPPSQQPRSLMVSSSTPPGEHRPFVGSNVHKHAV